MMSNKNEHSEKERLKTMLKNSERKEAFFHSKLLKGFGFILLFFSLLLIHELSHVITALLLNQEITKIGIGFANDSLLSLAFYVRIDFTDNHSLGLVALAGSLGALIISSLIIFLSLKVKDSLLFFLNLGYILSEITYWIISPLIRLGDAYIFIKSFNISLIAYFTGIFIILFIISLVSFILYKKTFSWKAKKRLIQERKKAIKTQERQLQLKQVKKRFNLL